MALIPLLFPVSEFYQTGGGLIRESQINKLEEMVIKFASFALDFDRSIAEPLEARMKTSETIKAYLQTAKTKDEHDEKLAALKLANAALFSADGLALPTDVDTGGQATRLAWMTFIKTQNGWVAAQ